jgi:four helix bundle protein
MINNRNLLERTLKFSEDIIELVNKLPKNVVNNSLAKQLVDAGTSIGANYREACEAESSKDFVHKMKVSKKEAKETTYWLKLLLKSNLNLRESIIRLGKESVELTKIFSSIVSKFKTKF